jgi:hypothetical protein
MWERAADDRASDVSKIVDQAKGEAEKAMQRSAKFGCNERRRTFLTARAFGLS